MKFETAAIRTQLEQTSHKEHSTPLFLTSSFTFDSAKDGSDIFAGNINGNLYSRFSNPNVDEFVNKMCQMEKCESGVATASGMAAVFTSLMSHLKSGDHIVASREIFGNSSFIIKDILPKYGIEFSFVPVTDNESWVKAVKRNTKLLFVETPSNPTLQIADIEFLGNLCKSNGLILAVDNCFATPFLQQPSLYGADLIIHSATKYIDGQGRVLGGVILGNEKLIKPCYDFLRRTGASLSPFNAWVLSKSLETLSIRMERHSSNAASLAKHLSSHPDVKKVIYPHDINFPQYKLAKKQMALGGGLVGFEINGGLKRSEDFLNRLKLFSLTANLGDTRSIATHPRTTTHSKLNPQAQEELGITDSFLRLSVGLEHINDIVKDINQALTLSK